MPIPTDSQAYAESLLNDVKNYAHDNYPNQYPHISFSTDQEFGFPPGSGNGRVYVDMHDSDNKRIGSCYSVRDVDHLLRRFRR